jgi:hypothetical protein
MSGDGIKGTGCRWDEGPVTVEPQAHDFTPTLHPVRVTQLATPRLQAPDSGPDHIRRLMTLSRATRNNIQRLSLRMGQRKVLHEMPTCIGTTSTSPGPLGATWYS